METKYKNLTDAYMDLSNLRTNGYALFAKFLTSKDFTGSHQDPCMFIHKMFHYYISLYVDDIAINAAGTPHLTTVINDVKTAFEISDLGEASFLLSLHITYTSTGIGLTQELYIRTILSRFAMENSNTVSIPLPKGITLMKGTTEQPKDQVTLYQSIIGSRMYLVTSIRPDLAYTISLLVQFSSCPTEEHIKAAKQIFRYVNRTRNLGLLYPHTTTKAIDIYVNADFAGCLDTRRSTSGYIVLFNNCCCNDPTIGSYNHYHLSPNGKPRGNQRWYGLVYLIQIAGKPRIRPRE